MDDTGLRRPLRQNVDQPPRHQVVMDHYGRKLADADPDNSSLPQRAASGLSNRHS